MGVFIYAIVPGNDGIVPNKKGCTGQYLRILFSKDIMKPVSKKSPPPRVTRSAFAGKGGIFYFKITIDGIGPEIGRKFCVRRDT